MNERIEEIILRNLFKEDNYTRKVLPYIKDEYFADQAEAAVYKNFSEHFEKYNMRPTPEELIVKVNSLPNLSTNAYDDIKNLLGTISKEISSDSNVDWLINETEKWCKQQSMYNAILSSSKILSEPKADFENIRNLVSEALKISFDDNVGLDFFNDAEERWEKARESVDKFPFLLEMFNKITNGGLEGKTLNLLLASTNVGKSALMCSLAADYLSQGVNVLYITMEMAEIKIANRIEANMFNMPMKKVASMDKKSYLSKIDKLRNNVKSNLFIKEYPTGTPHVGHFRNLLYELEMKKSWKPTVIFIDYLGICSSFRVKSSDNMYNLYKSVAEELRGLAVETGCPIVSAIQTNRKGYQNSDVELSETGESTGINSTADLILAMIKTDELDKVNQIMIKQLKSRYDNPSDLKRFVIGVDYPTMKYFDVENATESLIQTNPKLEKLTSSKTQQNSKFTGFTF